MTLIEKKLKESEERFKALFKGGPIPTYAWQKEGKSFKLIDFNNAAEEITQGNVDNFLGITASKMYKGRSDILKDLNSCYNEKINITREMKYTFTTSEEEKDLQVTYSYIPPDSVLVHTEDITDRKNSEQKLKDSEEKYRSIFSNMTEGFAYHEVIVDENNNPIDYLYLEVNPAFEKLTGLKADQMIGKKVTEILPGTENDPADWIGKFGNVGLTGIPLSVEDYSEALDHWYKVSGYSPKKGYFAVTFSDITEQKKAEIKIAESEEKYRNLFNNAPFAIVLFNTEGIILDCNDASNLITGYPKEELIGKHFRDFNFYIDIKSANIKEREDKIKSGKPPAARDVLLQRKDGNQFWARTSIEFVHMRDKTYIQAIIQDVSKQKQSQLELKESESKFRSIFEAIPDLYFLVSGDGTILDYRGREQDLYVSPEEFMGRKVVELVPPNLGKSITKLIKNTLKTKQPQIIEYELQIKDKKRFFESRYFYMSKEKVFNFIRDITDRKSIEKQISDLAKFPSENPNPVLRVNRENIIYTNKAGRDLFDLTEGSKIPKLLEEITAKAFNENATKILEVEFGDKNYMFNITPILQEGYANIYGGDITERKKSEIALNLEKKFTDDILNSSMDTVFVFNPEIGRAIRWNSTFKKVCGYSDEEIASMKAPDSYYTEEDLKHSSEATKNVLKDGETTIEMSLITKDGRSIPYEYTATMLEDSDGKLLIVSVGRDLTERKEVEKRVQYQANLVENVSDAILSLDLEFNILSWNKAAETIYGWEEWEVIGKNINEIIPVEFPNDENDKVVKEFFEKGYWKGEGIQYRKDGPLLNILSSSKFLIDNKGNRTGMVTINHDNTEYKLAEEKLRDSEIIFRDLYKEAPNAYFSISPDKSIKRTNKAAEKILGYTEEEFLNLTAFDLYSDGEYGVDRAKEVFKKFLEGEIIQDMELQMKKKNGAPVWVSLSVKPIFDSKGIVIESRSMVLDINDRKIAQEEVKNSYKKLEELEYIVSRSPGVVFLWKNSEGWPVEFVSENVDQWGYNPDDFYSGKVVYENIMHPDDLQRVSEEVDIYSNEDINDFTQEYRIITKSGETRWLDDRSWIRRDSNGNITHFQGIVLDITDRKITEEALKHSEKRYKEAYDRGNFYKDLFAHDMNNILQVVNSSAELIKYQLGESEKSKEIDSISDIIKKQVNRGSKLISNVRTLSELEEKEIITRKVEIGSYLRNSITFVEKAYEERNVYISVSSFKEDFYTHANELLQDVFENVLINSIKYNENSKVEISIDISNQKIDKKKYYKIEFLDNGIGVAEHRKEVIFKSGNRELKGSKGMGLGLSLVNKILQIFNGKIWVEDKVKGDYTQGSNFVIILPEVQ